MSRITQNIRRCTVITCSVWWVEFGCRFYRRRFFRLPFLPVAFFTCCPFFRCPLYRCRNYRCRFYRCPFFHLPINHKKLSHPGKWPPGKRLSGKVTIRESSFGETSYPGKWLSGKRLSGKRLSGKVTIRETTVNQANNAVISRRAIWSHTDFPENPLECSTTLVTRKGVSRMYRVRNSSFPVRFIWQISQQKFPNLAQWSTRVTHPGDELCGSTNPQCRGKQFR